MGSAYKFSIVVVVVLVGGCFSLGIKPKETVGKFKFSPRLERPGWWLAKLATTSQVVPYVLLTG